MLHEVATIRWSYSTKLNKWVVSPNSCVIIGYEGVDGKCPPQ